MESYKNILANKFMRDTNYIIIKDTDDLEELERQYELFNSQLTTRQQRLSDDRSIEIWNMTNQEHYEALKIELMKKIDSKFGDEDLNKEYDAFSYDPEEDVDDDEITSILNADLDNFEIPDDDNDITEPFKEESTIPIKNNDTEVPEPGYYYSNTQDMQKDNIADQYEIDSNVNIIGRVVGKDVDDYLSNLEKSFTKFNSQTHDHKNDSDDKCREIYGMSNIERYNKLKADALKFKSVKTVEKVVSTDNETLDSSQVQHLGEFVSQVYDNMQVVNEIEKLKVNKHKRFNDTPYFTPTELIDMGVHGNHNFYSNEPDNDGLITNVKVATWFDSYKDMCMDHIFEDYRKDWIDTLDMLYSDFENIKSSGDEEKILARKQSILDLGWNPEIQFNRKNRLKASKRVSKILDETIPRDIFINLNDIAEEDDIVEEQITKQTHKPVLLIFTQGKTPVVSQGIKLFTGSSYSHASISFDPELNEVYSYNMRGENFGFVRENLSSFKDNIISVMAFFAPNHIVESLKNKINDFKDNKTTFDLRIFFNKILHIDHKVSKNEYNQVCSTFVDTVLKSGGINLVGDIEIPDPGQLYNASKSVPNKIIEVFNDIATKYNGKTVKKKLNTLYNKKYISIEEALLIDVTLRNATKDDMDNRSINEVLSDIANGVNPYSTKTFYHVSFDDNLDEEVLKPRIPTWITNELKKDKNFIKELEKLKDSNSSEGLGFEEYKTPRVCLSNSIEGCLNAIINEKGRLTLHDKTLYVYTPEKPISEYKHKTNKQILKDGDIFDANTTNEMWILEPVKMKYVGSIVVDKITNEQVKKFANNKNKTNIQYKYKWHWFHKVKYRYDIKKNKLVKESKDFTDNINEAYLSGLKDPANISQYHGIVTESNDKQRKNNKGEIIPNECPKCGSKIGVFFAGEPVYKCTNKECNQYFGVVPFKESVEEPTSSFNETMELYLTKPKYIFKKNITLYHGTSKKIPNMIIDPKYGQLNTGTKLSSPRYSTWWVDDEFFAMTFGINAPFMKKYNLSYEMVSYNFIAVDYENKIIYVNEKEKDTVKKILNETDRYMYVANIPTNIIGRGHNIEIEEYTVDVPIKADKEVKITYNAMKPYIRIIPQEQFQSDEMIKKYTLNANERANPNVIEKLIYKSRDEFYEERKYNRFLSKLGAQNESVSVLNEVKRFPIEFDKEGNLIIYKARIGSLAFGDEIDDSVQLLQAYRNASNIEGIKYELAKLWYINDCIEKKLKKRLSNDEYKELIDTRATCLNVFKTNLDYVMKAEKGFNFSDYYNSTPFSDNSTKITANTLKYAVKTITNMI